MKELLNKVQKLRSLDKRCTIFGANSHQYRFRKVLQEEEVQKFEECYQIRLPEDYRNFLLEVGNGGAGPYYGINRLEDAVVDYHKDKKDYLKEPFPHTEDWNWSSSIFQVWDWISRSNMIELSDFFHQKYLLTSEEEVSKPEWEAIKLFSGMVNEDTSDFFESVYSREYFNKSIDSGSIDICDYGCGLRFKLIISGPERGNIWFDSRVDQGGLRPIKNSEGEKMNFLEWYNEWLEDSLHQFSGRRLLKR